MQDDRVPALRERLNVLGDGGTTYDKPVADAVKKFQQQRQIAATGTLTAATVDALNGKAARSRDSDIILANLERWRWMPHRFPDNYVLVNLPDFTLHVMHDSKEIWQTRIVIGKPEMPTPIMTADMKYITVNPTWNVPPSIVNREYLPALAQDPTVLDRMGLKVSHNPDGTVHISQPPGDKNALGRIRFNFPNKFLVYQHDTPDKYMFAYDKRALSHGCMRVQNPQHYAEVLLSLVRPNDGYSEERIKKMIAEGSETDIQFPTFVQVNLTYQTAFVDDDGKLQFRDDVYGRDKALIAILKGDDRKMAWMSRSSTKWTLRTAKSWRCPTSRRCSAAIAACSAAVGGIGGRRRQFLLAAVRRLRLGARAAGAAQVRSAPPARSPARAKIPSRADTGPLLWTTPAAAPRHGGGLSLKNTHL